MAKETDSFQLCPTFATNESKSKNLSRGRQFRLLIFLNRKNGFLISQPRKVKRNFGQSNFKNNFRPCKGLRISKSLEESYKY